MEFPKDEIEYETKVDYKAVFILGLFIWVSVLSYKVLDIDTKNKIKDTFKYITNINTNTTNTNIKDKNVSIKSK
jgi:hypothetical protein